MFQLTCETLGWCYIGFGDAYPNADIIRLSSANNVVKIEDMTAKPGGVYVPPQLDAEQDVTLLSGYQNGTHTYGKFTRKLISDDYEDYSIRLMRMTPMIWALGDGNVSTPATIQGDFEVMFGYNTTYQCHYQCSQCVGPLVSDCVICAVENAQSLNGYCSISDLDELDASLEIIADDFIVYWGYPMDGYIDLMMKVAKCDWFGLGFKQNMINTDVVLFKLDQINNTMTKTTNYVVEVHDMWSYANVIPDEDTMRGGKLDW